MLIFANAKNKASLSRGQAAGRFRRIAPGIYTTDVLTDPGAQIRANLADVVAHLRPGALFTHRSAFSADFGASDGFVVLTDPSLRSPTTQALPGVVLRVYPGPGPVDGDIPLNGGAVFVASLARAALESMGRSRAMAQNMRSAPEEVLMLKRLAPHLSSDVAWELFFAKAERVAEQTHGHFAPALSALRDWASQQRARQRRVMPMHDGFAIDGPRMSQLEAFAVDLQRGLEANASYAGGLLPDFPSRPSTDDARFLNQAFFESYFSNYIEGTQFAVDEAYDIAHGANSGVVQDKDGHDIRSLYRLYADPDELLRAEGSAQEFIDNLRHWHFQFMNNPGKQHLLPGRFKTLSNRAGATYFTEPGQVEGTLRRAWDIERSLKEPFDRAVFRSVATIMVHPFMDGNGRITRLSASSVLAKAGKARLFIPTVFRDDYITAMAAFAGGERLPIIATLKRAMDMALQAPMDRPWMEVRDFLRGRNAFESAEDAQWGKAKPLPGQSGSMLDAISRAASPARPPRG